KTFANKEAASGIVAVGSAILSMGKAPGEAVTGLRNLFVEIARGENAAKSTKDALDALGFDDTKMPDWLNRDAIGLVQDLFKRLSEAPKDQQGGLLDGLFGKKGVDALAPLLADVEELNCRLPWCRTRKALPVQREVSSKSSLMALMRRLRC
ncbi:MAG: phage tail tape measure protein, partial [Pseudomonadota bacterium]